MKTTLEKTALDLLGLPTSSRALLAEKLLASLEDNEPSSKVEQSWDKEALKRYKKFKAGKTKVLSHEAVMQDAYRAVGGKLK